MKKILFTTVSALALAAFADGVNSTEFGVLHVPSDAATTIVSVPWLESGTGSDPVQDAVSVSNLVLTAGLSVNDQLMYYNADNSSYVGWVIAENAGVKYWTPSQIVKEGPDGKSITIPAAPASEVRISRGGAVIVKRLGTITQGAGFDIMGKPSSDTATIPLGSSQSAQVYSLIAPPNVSSEAGVNVNTGMTWTNLDVGDMLYVNGKYYIWAQPTSEVSSQKWVDALLGPTSEAIVIPFGQGAWFISVKTSTTGKTAVLK